jgi:hypothetical protein
LEQVGSEDGLELHKHAEGEERGPSAADVLAHVSTNEADMDEIAARKDVYIEETALPAPASAAGTTDDNLAATLDEAISKRAMKPSAQPSPRSNNRPPAASAQPVPPRAEIKTEAARRAEMEEEAFSKVEADHEWLKTQEILDGDGRIWPVTAGDIPLWVEMYLRHGQPVTDKKAKAGVARFRNRCPGMKTEHFGNVKA